ncbi:hypothetical protein LLE87_26315 [Paenibacillus polymyxa]|uniref:Uncharacterized protein n=1 Tax=Paenibacillus polymyxa TaxID=1406 RepID=A0A379LUY8_PAEPO|nr:hypothetical protein [Paenibacillus polymyxa]UOD88805.1 hypothetical protein CUU60_27045 [Paenibacillus polymyxa ATCC 842]MCC3261699.1 hypothetical protein [Paenibacillus polymyxa]WEK68071.1 hypothetical protein ERJ71_26965 [Paenibacillus polymyxa]SUE13153.1 Uncharacterised protein [Paenibacillus polymyxa]
MDFVSLNESFSPLQKLTSSPLLLHVHEILSSEDADTKIAINITDKPDLFSLLLVTTNAKENYWNMHIFYMDQVEKHNKEYRYHTFSNNESIHLHNCLSQLFK